MLTEWQRIEKIVKWVGMSVNSFAGTIGLNRSENLYQIKRGNNGISKDLADLIVGKYPQISKGWLLSGEGEMFRQKPVDPATRIPYYEVDAERFIVAPDNYASSRDLVLPMFDDCDFATIYLGRAMSGSIPVGSIVLFRKIDVASVLPGSECLIVGDKVTVLRRVRRASEAGKLRLEPADTSNFDEIIIDESQVRAVYQVKGVIINKVI